MATVIGSELLARALKSQGVDTMFYVMGGPMLETEATCIKLGIRAIDTRHEQAASLSSLAWGGVTGLSALALGCSVPGEPRRLAGYSSAGPDVAPQVACGGGSPRLYFRMKA